MSSFTKTLALAILIGSVSISSAIAQSAVDETVLKQRVETIIATNPDVQKATVEVKVEATQKPEGRSIDLNNLDINNDGNLSREEVGTRLFEVFDRDGNMVIDNIEMNMPSLIVFVPMKKETVETVTFFDDNRTAKTDVSVEDFLFASNLGKFDKDRDGLSPLDFLGMSFNKVNVKRDTVIDLYEFQRAYAKTVRPLHQENFFYNK